MALDMDNREVLRDIGANAAKGKTGLSSYIVDADKGLVGLIWKPKDKEPYTTVVQEGDAAAIVDGFTQADGEVLGPPNYEKTDVGK